MALKATLIAMCAAVAGGRRYWLRAPQGAARPFLVMSQIAGDRHYHNQGATGLVPYRVQFDVYADDALTADNLMTEVIQRLSGVRAGQIRGVFFGVPRDLPVTDAGEVTHLTRMSVDATIHWTE